MNVERRAYLLSLSRMLNVSICKAGQYKTEERRKDITRWSDPIRDFVEMKTEEDLLTASSSSKYISQRISSEHFMYGLI